ncbi:MAG: hypothetical protein FJZ58_05595 [Chlamydiae bacterium]|nr:hypothetical protein [Chlamydiota bacterium]
MKHPFAQKPIPLGVDNYERIVQGGYLYMDKTLLIKEFWDSGSVVTLVTRPRRFGKSIALSMMRCFFEKTEKSKSHLFTHTKIWQEEHFQELQGTYPVIHLSFKDIKALNWEEAFCELQTLLAQEVHRMLAPVITQLDEYYNRQFKALVEKTANKAEFSDSLRLITEVLYKVTKKNTIILLDEYDAPITHAYTHRYYDEMLNFMRQLLSKTLKGNDYLCKGFMTGIVRTAKDGILSGLNNPQICTMLDWNFSDKFGFTEKEMLSLLQERGLLTKKEEVTTWYNGYIMGVEYLQNPATAHLSTPIYNPWSVLSYLESLASPKTYWANTGSTALLERLIAEAGEDTQRELETLLEKGFLERKQVNQDVILLELDKKDVEPWSFLFFAGYLTTTKHTFQESKHYYTLAIPNEEIRELYRKLVLSAIGKSYTSQKLTSLLDALITGKVSLFTELLELFIQKFCSSHDMPHQDVERSLHLFVLGLLASFSERYTIKSNLESGRGRYDIAMHPKQTGDHAIIIECKKGQNTNLSPLAVEAVEQIKQKNYLGLLRDFGYQGEVLCYGIAAFHKQVAVQLEKLHL